MVPGEGRAKRIFTLGTSDRSWDEFSDILRTYELSLVIDVRSFPVSRLPHFARENMRDLLERMDLAYLWMGESLGGYRKGGYEGHTTTSLYERGIRELEKAAVEKRSVIICAERLPWKCHRRFIARTLEGRGWEVMHIIERDRLWIPKRYESS
jgi:uncharacterized protein (DUF488 family)